MEALHTNSFELTWEKNQAASKIIPDLHFQMNGNNFYPID
jgi:hypothetical protein